MFTNCYPAHRSRRAEIALLLTAAVVALSIPLPISAQAQTETVLYNFNYNTFDLYGAPGCPPAASGQTPNENPHTGVLFYNGALYGTTPEGGASTPKVPDSDRGMVFRLTKPKSGGTPWVEATLHSFNPQPRTAPPPDDGMYPCSRLIEKNGTLFGTTVSGGTGGTGAIGVGTIFALVPPATGQTAWTEYQLYNFGDEGAGGGAPFDGLTMGSDGSLYGVNNGAVYFSDITGPSVFQLTPQGNLITMVTNSIGIVYNGDLLLDSTTGDLYGTTQNGGPIVNGVQTLGYGNVFELTLVEGYWRYEDLYDFNGFDGNHPNGGLVGGPGDFLGTTQLGGNPNCQPGDILYGCGVLFELRQLTAGSPYTLVTQHTFATPTGGVDGSTPVAGLYQDAKGTLWGTTTLGGKYNNAGTIFELYPDRYVVHDWHYLVAYNFVGGITDGANPQGLLTEDPSGNLYGTTNAGGKAGEGVVFQLSPDYTLTVTKAGSGGGTVASSPRGIICGATCSASYINGTVVTLTAAPDTPGSTFAGWSGACTGTGTCSVTMSAAKSVTATFNVIKYTLTVGKAGTGSGTVTSSPSGINCGTTCSTSFNSGTVVTLTATPATGSTFAGWSGACTGTGSCKMTMNAAESVTATFQ